MEEQNNKTNVEINLFKCVICGETPVGFIDFNQGGVKMRLHYCSNEQNVKRFR